MTLPSFAEPYFGAVPSQDGVRFRVMAPGAQQITLVLENGTAAGEHPLSQSEEGVFETWIRGAGAGDRYAYLIDREGPYPDPATRSQPDGVHGRSQVVDPGAFPWTDGRWRLRQIQDLIVYELHVGTFTDEGTFTAVRGRLPYLRDLGITAVELMPVADFPGMRNWGYDPAALYAPARAYGPPEDLRALVDAAHGNGLAVILDVVYNHLGPEGAYVARFDRNYLTSTHRTPWGGAVNLDGPGSALIRRFIIDNATHWFREYHVDGLRLDSTHALIDESAVPLVQELADTIRPGAPRPVLLYAEDSRNLATIVQSRAAGGWGFDGVWADDFHHVLRRMLAGDAHAYFADFQGQARELADVVQKGWFYTGQHSPYFNGPRGTLPAGVPLYRFVICLQNHDQIGNRAMGDRIHERVSAEQWRAASVVLMTAPMTPLLFMGQEWAASTPFNYFTDLEPVLGASVTRGRRQEFAGFPEFSGPAAETIPDPQAEDTFTRSRLKWDEVRDPEHSRALALYRQLLVLRREHQALAASDAFEGHAVAPDDESIVVRRSDAGETFWIVARLRSSGEIDLAEAAATMGDRVDPGRLDLVLDTEHAEFTADPEPIHLAGTIRFRRPGAVILKA